ncbi:MAG: hypothetical protein K2Y27_20695 [Xanthobacteraceae bacterium]|nr:hypothetical protein [Xanthobacteraceae bacterium]
MSMVSVTLPVVAVRELPNSTPTIFERDAADIDRAFGPELADVDAAERFSKLYSERRC